MRVTLESTTRVVTINGGVEARVWEGTTASGIAVTALIPRIATAEDQPQGQFLAELARHRPPGPDATAAWPMRMLL